MGDMFVSKLLNAGDILSAPDLKPQCVEVPEWGGSVYIRCFTGAEREAFEEENARANGPDQRVNLGRFRVSVLVRTLADENGERLFDDKQMDALNKKCGAVLDRLTALALKINGMGAREVEDLTKNSESGQSVDSTSD